MKIHYAVTVFAKMPDIHSNFNLNPDKEFYNGRGITGNV